MSANAIAARTTADVRAEIEAQPVLQPGTEGWWKVYGVSGRHIRPGDYVLVGDDEFFVQDTYAPLNVARHGIVVDGERQTIGTLANVTVLRRGTKSTLGI